MNFKFLYIFIFSIFVSTTLIASDRSNPDYKELSRLLELDRKGQTKLWKEMLPEILIERSSGNDKFQELLKTRKKAINNFNINNAKLQRYIKDKSAFTKKDMREIALNMYSSMETINNCINETEKIFRQWCIIKSMGQNIVECDITPFVMRFREIKNTNNMLFLKLLIKRVCMPAHIPGFMIERQIEKPTLTKNTVVLKKNKHKGVKIVRSTKKKKKISQMNKAYKEIFSTQITRFRKVLYTESGSDPTLIPWLINEFNNIVANKKQIDIKQYFFKELDAPHKALHYLRMIPFSLKCLKESFCITMKALEQPRSMEYKEVAPFVKDFLKFSGNVNRYIKEIVKRNNMMSAKQGEYNKLEIVDNEQELIVKTSKIRSEITKSSQRLHLLWENFETDFCELPAYEFYEDTAESARGIYHAMMSEFDNLDDLFKSLDAVCFPKETIVIPEPARGLPYHDPKSGTKKYRGFVFKQPQPAKKAPRPEVKEDSYEEEEDDDGNNNSNVNIAIPDSLEKELESKYQNLMQMVEQSKNFHDFRRLAAKKGYTEKGLNWNDVITTPKSNKFLYVRLNDKQRLAIFKIGGDLETIFDPVHDVEGVKKAVDAKFRVVRK